MRLRNIVDTGTGYQLKMAYFGTRAQVSRFFSYKTYKGRGNALRAAVSFRDFINEDLTKVLLCPRKVLFCAQDPQYDFIYDNGDGYTALWVYNDDYRIGRAQYRTAEFGRKRARDLATLSRLLKRRASASDLGYYRPFITDMELRVITSQELS